MSATWEANFEVRAGDLQDAIDKAAEVVRDKMKVEDFHIEIEPEILSDMTIAGEHSLHVGLYNVRAWGDL